MPTPEPSSKVIRAGKTININTADIGELKDLPDVGEATAKKIVAFREANGPFQNVESIMLIDGISEKRFRQIEPFITTQ